MYEYDGDQYTLQELQDSARAQNLDFDVFMKNMRSRGLTEKREQQESLYGPDVDPVVGFAADVLTSIPQSGLKAVGGIVNILEAGERTIRDYLYRDLSDEEKQAKFNELEQGGFSLLSKGDDNVFSNAGKFFDQFDAQAEGSILKEIEDGNYTQAGAKAVVAGVESWPSIAAAYMGVPAIMALGASYAGNKFEEEYEKNPQASLGGLLVNAAGTGAIEVGFEMATRGLLKYTGVIGKEVGAEAAKKVLQGGMLELSKKIAGGYVFEGASEAATEVANNIWDSMTIEGREMPTFAQMKYQLGDAFIVGGLVGGGIGTFGAIKSRGKASVDAATITLMPQEEKQKFQQSVVNIQNLHQDRRKAKTDEAREIIDQEIIKETQVAQKIKNDTQSFLENLSSKNIKQYTKNIVEINKLKSQIKDNSDNKTIQKVNSEKIKTLNTTNVNLLEASKTDLAEQQFKNIQDIAVELEKAGGQKINVLKGNTKDFEKFSKDRGVTEKFDYSRRYGGMLPVEDADGNVTSLDIFINEETVLRDGKVNTSAHEFLHAAVFATLKQDIESGEVLGDAVLRALTANKATLREGSDFNDRINSYSKEEGAGEEILTLTAEAISNNEINLNEGFIGGLKDAFRRFGQRYLNFDMDLNKDQDVLNFVKDYARAIKDPSKLNKALIKVAAQGAKGRLAPQQVTPDPKLAVSKEASDNVQRIYEDQGARGAFEIINEFKPIVNRIVDKRKDAPNFDRQLLTDEIETGQRGILDLIGEYKPESGVPLAAFINKFLPARAIEASRRVLGEEFTQDVTEAKGVIAEETADVEVETTREQKETVVADRLGVSEQAAKTIEKVAPDLDFESLNYKTLKNQLPDIVGELFGIKAEKLTTLANLTKKETQTAQMFINKNADLLIALLPEGATAGGTATGVPNTLLKAFYTKTDRAKAATTGSKAGLAIQQKNDIDREIFLETFGIINGKPDRTDRNISARILAIANVTGQVITNQTVRQNQKALGITQEAINRIKDGKSRIMFSQAARQKTLEVLKIKIPSTLNSKDRKAFINWIVNEYATYLPILQRGGYMLHAETFGMKGTGDNPDIVRPSFFISKNEVTITARKAGMKQKKGKPFTKEQVKQIKEVYRSKRKDFNNLGKNLELLKSGVDYFVKGLNKTVNGTNGNNQNLKWLEVLLRPSGSATTHVMRMMAPALGKTNVDKVGEKEHAMPADFAGDIVFNAIAYNHVDLLMPWFVENYYMIGLSESQNGQIPSSLSSSMPEVFNENLQKAIEAKDMSLASDPLIRYTMSNINLSEVDWHDGGTALSYVDKKYGFGGSLSYGNGNAITVERVNKELSDFFAKKINLKQAKEAIETISKTNYTKDIKSTEKFGNVVRKSRLAASKDPKGITVLDFDDTLATSKSLVRYTGPDGETGTLNAEQYANTYQDLQDQGYKFDFSEFNKVVGGKIAPLFQKALKLQGKFGPENMFVLTARPPQAQKAIFDFLKANGLNIPLKNITGLGNSTAEAKALWIADKVGEGYNDFYFADDALQNVQAVDNMLEQFDVKRKVQQARIQFSKDLDGDFNKILEDVTGIEAFKRFDFIKARKRGSSKGKFRFFIPPSHEDFAGLLYNFMGKGRKGDAHRDFLEKSLIRPLNRANREYDTARQSIATDYRNLNKQFPEIKKMFTEKTPDGDFVYQDAIRVYLWDKHGYDIPGLSDIDQKNLVELVESNGKLKAYADAINTISRQETYVDPTDGWDSGDIRMDLDDATGRVGRSQFFEEFVENADIIFSTENLNKIEAGYGKGVRGALEDMLYRIKTGRNKPTGQSGMVNSLMNWVNGSVGSVMFFNMRSALLQQMSLVNYINFADNNIFAAAKAFANQKQYWNDWSFIFNSDMLKQRRGGIMTDVNGAELAAEMRKSKNPHRFLISKLLQLGFLPTQIGDNIAIATGGATYYRNRINTYLKEGLSKKEAEEKAFTDFQDITQSTQQSARPDMVSQQQASLIGKIILNFQNVTSQFNRLGKKAVQDIYNRRITKPNKTQMQSDISNAARITYYFAVQNAIFYTLQTALFMMMFDDDEEDVNNLFLKKQERLINGSIDSVLRGSGILGAVISTLKNTAIAWARQRDINYNPDESAVIVEALNFSPVIGIKVRKIVNAEKTLNYNKKVIKEMDSFDIDNPQWSATTNYIEGFTNAPVNRLYNKTQNVRQALNNDHTSWERMLMFLGWSQYNLNLENKEIEEVKKKIKADTKKQQKKKKKKKPSRRPPVSI